MKKLIAVEIEEKSEAVGQCMVDGTGEKIS